MGKIVFKNKEGFSLVEFLVAMVILTVGLLGLLQAVNLSINHNMQNEIRNIAVTLADEMMSEQKKQGFESLEEGTLEDEVERSVSKTRKKFNVVTDVLMISKSAESSKQITVTVRWDYKQRNYSHSISSIVSDSKH